MKTIQELLDEAKGASEDTESRDREAFWPNVISVGKAKIASAIDQAMDIPLNLAVTAREGERGIANAKDPMQSARAAGGEEVAIGITPTKEGPVGKYIDKHEAIKALVEEKYLGKTGESAPALKAYHERSLALSDSVTAALESNPLTTPIAVAAKAIGWASNLSTTPEEDATMAAWAKRDPFTGNPIQAVREVAKAGVSMLDSIALSALPGGTLSMMRDEAMTTLAAEYEKQKLPFDPTKANEVANIYAAVGGSLEFIGASTTVLGAIGRSVAAPLIKGMTKKVAVKTMGGTIAKTAAVGTGLVAIDASLEGVTEGSQEYLLSQLLNNSLADTAQVTGLPVKLKSPEDIRTDVRESALVGAMAGLSFGGPGATLRAPAAVIRDVKAVQVSRVADTAVGQEIGTYRKQAQMFADIGVEKSTQEAKASLEATGLDELLTVIKGMKIEPLSAKKEDLIQQIMDNRHLSSKFLEQAQQATFDTIANSDHTNMEKNFYKWMTQGNIVPEQVPQIQAIMRHSLRGLGKTETLEQWFDDSVDLSGKKGFLEFEQLGRSTPSGNVIKGQTRIMNNGKLVIDLFKTGDMLTVAHEFMHGVSPLISEETREQLILSVLKDEKMKGSDAKIRSESLRMAWEIFSNDQTDPYFKEFPQLHADLMVLQEKLATSFEAYLTKEKAPHHDLVPAFRSFRSTLVSYYKEVNKKVPRQYRKVQDDMAASFDRMLVEVPLARDTHETVTMRDKEGGMVKYTLRRSRPQNEAHRRVLEYLNRAKSEGLQEQLMNYAALMEVELTPARINEAMLVQNKGQGLAFLRGIDEEYVLKQERERVAKVKEVRSLLKSLQKKQGVAPELLAIAEGILEEVDTKVRSEKRIRKVIDTINKLNGEYDELIEDLDGGLPSLKELRDVLAMGKTSLDNMTEEQLQVIKAALSDLVAYNIQTLHAFLDAKAEARIADAKQFVFENNGNHWYQDNKNRNVQKVRGWDIIGKYKNFVWNNSRAFSAFSQAKGDMWDRILSRLDEGRAKERHLALRWRKMWGALSDGVFVAGVSEEFGKVKDSEKLMADMITPAGRRMSYGFTRGQLMMIYGKTFNEKTFESIMEGGLYVRELGETLMFTSEEHLNTMINKLSPAEKKLVEETIAMFSMEIYPVFAEAFSNILGLNPIKEENWLPSSYRSEQKEKKGTLHLKLLGETGEQWYRNRLMSLSFLRPRLGGKAPQNNVDFFAEIAETLETIAKFSGMAEPLDFARTRIFDGGDQENTASYQYKKMVGSEKYQGTRDWLDHIEDSSKRENSFINALGKIAQNVRSSIMLWAPSMAALQPTAIIAGMGYGLSPADILKSMAGGLLKGPRVMSRLASVSEMMEDRFHNVPAVYQEATGRSHNTRHFTLKPISYMEEFAKAKTWRDIRAIGQRIDQSGTFALVYLDAYALSVLYDATEAKGKREGWTPEQIRERFELIVKRTQSVNDPLYTSNFLAEKGALARMTMIVFQTTLDSFRGEIQTNHMELKNLWKGGEKKEGQSTYDRLNNLFRLHIVLPVVAGVIQESYASIGKDEDDEEIPFLLRIGIRSLTNWIGMWAFIGDPINSVINKLAYGYWGSQNLLLAPLSSAANHAGKAIAAMGKDDALVMAEFAQVGTELSRYKGTSLANIAKLTDKMRKMFENF